MIEPEDPVLQQALRKMTAAFDRMAETRASVERTPLPSFTDPRHVDDSFMYGMASLPGASPELRAYAARVGAGECTWSDIEYVCRPIPSEVAEIKRDPLLIWFTPRQASPPDDEPYTIPWQ